MRGTRSCTFGLALLVAGASGCATTGASTGKRGSGIAVTSQGGCTTDARNHEESTVSYQVTPSGDADLCAALQRAFESELVRFGFDVVTAPNAPFAYQARMKTRQVVSEGGQKMHAVSEVEIDADGRVVDHVQVEGEFGDTAQYTGMAAKLLVEKLLASKRIPRSGESTPAAR